MNTRKNGSHDEGKIQRKIKAKNIPKATKNCTKEQRRPSLRLREANAANYVDDDVSDDEYAINSVDLTDPQSYTAAMKTINADIARWKNLVKAANLKF
jgi:hypothetical protein